MKVRFQKQKLESTLRAFYKSTGIKLAVLDADFTSISSLPEVENDFCSIVHKNDCNKQCYNSDLKILEECSQTLMPTMHVCHAGLIDIALPIMHNGTIMGYIIMGQLRRNIPFEEIEDRFDWLEKDKAQLKKAYSDMMIYDEERVESLANLAVMLASYIMTEEMIKEDHSLLTEKFAAFVRDNIRENLSVEEICKNMNVSKNTLYRHLRRHLGMSVNEYILCQRISLAKELLSETKESVGSICEKVGISDTSYFCKLFKARTGLSPTKYRRMKYGIINDSK